MITAKKTSAPTDPSQIDETGPKPAELTSFKTALPRVQKFKLVKSSAPKTMPEETPEEIPVSSGNSQNVARDFYRVFYQQFFNTIRQCFWLIDLDRQEIISVSENFETVWGSAQNLLFKDGIAGFMSSVFSDDRDRVLADFHTYVNNGPANDIQEPLDIELRVIDKEGEIRWMWMRSFTVQTENGANCIAIVADDISAKKLAEEQVRAREAELVARARALAVVDLATGVAHEINNPLTVIVGKAAELKRLAGRGELDANSVLAAADKIQTTSIRISEIIKSLKSLARQDRSRPLAAYSFNTIVNEIRDLSSERFKDGGVKLEILSPPESLTTEMNPTLISQLILNLVNNAFDAIALKPDKWVRVEFLEDEQSVFIGVVDCGNGIPIKIRNRIFDPFFTTKEPGKGTGLGLSLSASIAAHHHGVLRLDTLHLHTRFVLQLPKRQPKS